jgi:predicted RNase H-like HicB family nuclease
MAESAMKYHVVVTRDGDGWMADVPALSGTHTWAKTLRALDRHVREVIGMVEDLPRSAEAAMDLDMEYHTAELSVGDAAVLLGVSKGRISQLRSGYARPRI